MLKTIFVFILALFTVLTFNITSISAQENLLVQNPTPAVATDSFTLFWPVVAGRTVDDKLFFLKELKENIMGMFIFGEIEKADYAIMLTTKRIVETEKLLDEGKEDFIIQTLEKAKTHLVSAKEALDKSKDKKGSDSNATANIKKQIENLNIFLPYLKLNAEDVIQVRIDEVHKLVNDVKSLLP